MKDNTPVTSKPYPLTIKQRELVKKILDDLESSGVISRANSPWSSPAFIKVKKSTGEGRPLVNYKKVNKQIQGNSNSAPRISTVIEAVGEGRIFSSIGLISSYFQFQIEEGSRDVTAFKFEGMPVYRFNSLPPVSYTHLTLPTIYSV